MSRLIKASIDVTKILKEHLYEGKKGKYANLDIWINDEVDQFGNICSIAQSFKVDDKFDKVYIGNGKDLKPKDVEVNDPVNANDENLPF